MDSIAGPTASGIEDSAITVDPDTLTKTDALIFDTKAATADITYTPPPLVVGSSTLVITTTPEPTPSESVDEGVVSDPSAAGASSNSISIGTVVGSCVGAFVGAALLIVLGLFLYKRYSRSLKQRAHTRGLPRTPYRDTRGGDDARRSWKALDDDNGYQDKWEGMKQKSATSPPAAAAPGFLVPPLEKMDMFNKPASDLSHRTNRSDDTMATTAFEMTANPSPYVQGGIPRMPEPRDILGREPHHKLGSIDTGPVMSWADSTTSFLSAGRLEGGAMSPQLTVAKSTPPATRVQTHHWESAEVVQFPEAQTADIVDETQQRYSRASTRNPFFGASEEYMPAASTSRQRSRSRSQSTARSRSNSTATATQAHAPPPPAFPEALSPKGKGKERAVSTVSTVDPFQDPLPPPTFLRHQATGSASSAADNERAIRQLVAAAGIDLDEDEVQRRLKALSLQPSVYSMSGDSMYTDADPGDFVEDDLRRFPAPPAGAAR